MNVLTTNLREALKKKKDKPGLYYYYDFQLNASVWGT